MKPIYLEFCGINSFSEKAQIDFRSLLAGGLFGIFGDTGSGKSTILDCIHLALYGVVERASKSMNDCIHYNADSAYVIFDFELTENGERRAYRVRRERKRKNGVTKAFLYQYTPDGGLLAIAEGTRDVDKAVEEIIGLAFNDFKMCIALPQGDFAALVKAATAERVKLVSRLFDLDKYGVKLWDSVNAKYYQAEQEVNLIKAEMGQNEGGRDEIIDEKRAEIAAEKQALDLAEERLRKAETEYETLAALFKEKLRFDEICKTLEQMQLALPMMEEKRRNAERLPLAKRVAEKAEEQAKNSREQETAKARAAEAKASRDRAKEEWQTAKKLLEDGNFDERIVQLSVQADKVRGAQKDIDDAALAKKRLDDCIAQFKQLQKACVAEDFDGKRAALETSLSELGEDDNLLDYIKHHCKAELLGETYEAVRLDLEGLSQKYPQTRADVAVLLQKYTLEKGDGNLDMAQLHLAFKQTEQRRKVLKAELENLEKRKREFDANETQKKLLTEQGKIFRQTYELAVEKIAFVQDIGPLNVLEKKLAVAREEKLRAEKGVETAQEKAQTYHVEMEKQTALFEKCSQMQAALAEGLQQALQESGFLSVEEAQALLSRLGDEDRVNAECKQFFEKYELNKSKRAEIDERRFIGCDEARLESARREKTEAQLQKDGCNRKIAASENELKRLEELREKYRAFEKTLAEKEKQKNLCDELRTLLRNNRFLEFIASEYLQEISISAGKRLLSLTGGRYFLRYDKEFKVGDNLDGGNLRAVKTLSGGETFLVSLSLALSLSEAICSKSMRPIEFFFLDEGFGTLDGKLVDTVMDVLGKLSKNFAVGLISHVEALKHRIDNKILVTGANERHGSQVRLEHF